MGENKAKTKGGVVLEDIEIGDIHYEYGYGVCFKSEVIEKPTRSEEGYWTWKSKSLKTGRIIEYGVSEDYPHYGPNLYNYPAYFGFKEQ